jgi:uncharacterized SAM-binding protein YcdF (DUF218 family)
MLLVKPLENNYAPLSASELNYESDYSSEKTRIVVLGGGMVRGTPDGIEIGKTTLKRLYKGWKIHQATGLNLVVSGGIVPGADDSPVAEAMKEVLVDWGVPSDKIIVEKESKNTWQNAVNTASILERSGYKRIVLVTSATHMQRAMYSFQKNWELDIVPVSTDYIMDTDLSFLDFLPGRSSLRNNLTALHEWVGLVWYYFK